MSDGAAQARTVKWSCSKRKKRTWCKLRIPVRFGYLVLVVQGVQESVLEDILMIALILSISPTISPSPSEVHLWSCWSMVLTRHGRRPCNLKTRRSSEVNAVPGDQLRGRKDPVCTFVELRTGKKGFSLSAQLDDLRSLLQGRIPTVLFGPKT